MNPPKMPVRIPSTTEIEASKTQAGGWTRETLASWGVSWPPPPGWRSALERGVYIHNHLPSPSKAGVGAYLGAARIKIRGASESEIILLAANLFEIDPTPTLEAMYDAITALGPIERKRKCRAYREANGIPHPTRPEPRTKVVFRPPPVRKPPPRIRLKPGQSFYDTDEWRDVRYRALVIHGGCCQCCGASPCRGKPLHVDHIKPRSKFPELELDLNNLQVLCKDCNLGKRAWDQTDWRPTAEAAE